MHQEFLRAWGTTVPCLLAWGKHTRSSNTAGCYVGQIHFTAKIIALVAHLMAPRLNTIAVGFPYVMQFIADNRTVPAAPATGDGVLTPEIPASAVGQSGELGKPRDAES